MERLIFPPVNIPFREKLTTFRPGAIASVGDFFISSIEPWWLYFFAFFRQAYSLSLPPDISQDMKQK